MNTAGDDVAQKQNGTSRFAHAVKFF